MCVRIELVILDPCEARAFICAVLDQVGKMIGGWQKNS